MGHSEISAITIGLHAQTHWIRKVKLGSLLYLECWAILNDYNDDQKGKKPIFKVGKQGKKSSKQEFRSIRELLVSLYCSVTFQ